MAADAPATVLVVGAGAAGLVAAIVAARAGARVTLIEGTRDGGRKILISGGGRCNVLPSILAPERFVTDSSPHALRNILRSWPLEEQRAFFEQDVRVPLTLETETGKLFPRSNRAADVRDALVGLARDVGVDLMFATRVASVTPGSGHESGAIAGAWTVALQEGHSLAAHAVVLATGGLSVPATGSDGAGLAIARRLGHVVHETYPALTPLVADPPVHASLSGISLRVRVKAPGGRPMEASGGFLFTHRGYSGPVALDISHRAVRAGRAGVPQPLLVRWCELDEDGWDARLRPADGLVVSRLREQLPQRLADRLLGEAGLAPDRSLATLRKAERRTLVDLLCRYALPWTGDEGYRKAEVTGGGVALAEVDLRTLESRRHPRLFFCGEILDAFGPIGGHNFAWAWATGRLAGLAAARPRV